MNNTISVGALAAGGLAGDKIGEAVANIVNFAAAVPAAIQPDVATVTSYAVAAIGIIAGHLLAKHGLALPQRAPISPSQPQT